MDRINNHQKKFASPLTDSQRDIQPPPPPDESYWSALLREGETAAMGSQRQTTGANSPNPTPTYGTESQAKYEHTDWEIVQKTYQDDLAIELPIIGYNRGGLLVEWNSLRGFVPASQLIDFPTGNDMQLRRGELVNRVGQKLL